MYKNYWQVLLALAYAYGDIPKYNKYKSDEVNAIKNMSNRLIRTIIPLSKVTERIIRECKVNFKIDVTRKEIKSTLWQGKKITFKSIIILMAVYNLLYRAPNHERAMELLKWYTDNNHEGKKPMHPYCVKEKVRIRAYNCTNYPEDFRYTDHRYQIMYETYRALCDGPFDKKLGTIAWEALVDDGFATSQFIESDIPERLRVILNSNAVKYMNIRKQK